MPKPPGGLLAELKAELDEADSAIVSAHAQLAELRRWRAGICEKIRQENLPPMLRATYRIIEHPSRGGGPSFRRIARIDK